MSKLPIVKKEDLKVIKPIIEASWYFIASVGRSIRGNALHSGDKSDAKHVADHIGDILSKK